MATICIVKRQNKHKTSEVAVEILGLSPKMASMNIIISLLKIKKDAFEFNEKNREPSNTFIYK